MSTIFNLHYSLQSICWSQQNKLLKNTLWIITGVLVLAICSQLTIPLHPIPLTFQSASVLLIALIYGARLGAATIVAYLVAGACGLPVFAGMTSGLSTLFLDPSSGYFLGFFFGGLLCGYLAERGWGNHFITALAAAFLGAGVIFYLGVTVLSYYIGWDQAYLLGLKPFLITEPIKLVLIALVAPRFWRTIEKDNNDASV